MAKTVEERLEEALERIADLQQENSEMKAARKADEKALRTREHENRDYRQQVKDLEAKVGEIEGQLPPEGSVVLKGDDANTWNGYQELGDLTSITTRLGQLDEARGKAKTLERRDNLRAVADQENWKLGVLEEQLDGIDLKVVKNEDDETSQTMVTLNGNKSMTVREYIEAERSDYLPALEAAGRRRDRAPVGPGPSSRPKPADQKLTPDQIYEEQRRERPVSL